jgi:RHS repeat-associated protein
MVAVQSSGSPLASYAINALGQRVSKTVGGVTTLFVYDEQGHLLGEYDGTGNLIQETVWLEDLPVATLRPTGSGYPTPIAIYYAHADHLGSPRAVTRPSDNILMWQWDNLDPFGANAANENPSGQGTFKYGLRFPGQYFDAETGTHYNYFRDYDATVGRYEQSDPIGMIGGPNTYIYVLSPVSKIDAKGLASQEDSAGCGSGPTGPYTPNNPIFKFKGCCDDHDNCYDNCEKKPTKDQCDKDFCRCVYSKCTGWGASAACVALASSYCAAGTQSQQAEKAFIDSRKKCEGPQACIRPTISTT